MLPSHGVIILQCDAPTLVVVGTMADRLQVNLLYSPGNNTRVIYPGNDTRYQSFKKNDNMIMSICILDAINE